MDTDWGKDSAFDLRDESKSRLSSSSIICISSSFEFTSDSSLYSIIEGSLPKSLK